jgi:SET domain
MKRECSLLLFLLSILRLECGGAFQLSRGPSARQEFTRIYSTQTARIDVSEYAPRNGQTFVEWATHYGVVPDNFQINPRSSNWGAEALYAAPAGSRVLFVPGMLRMTAQAAREQDFSNLVSTIDQYIDPSTNDGDVSLSDHLYLFLKVLQEYDLGRDSGYYPWLDAMPRKFPTAISFDDFEMDCLPPFVKFLAERDRENFNLFVIVLQQLDTPTISQDTKSDMAALRWAFNVVFTRARPAFGGAEIIPFSDVMNHAWNANCDVQYDNDGNVYVVLLRDVQAGDALHKCYGQPTNPSRFMSTYGFFDASPPTTYCKLMPTLAVTPELKNLGFEFDRMVFSVDAGDVAQEVWDVMLYLNLGRSDASTQRQFYQAHMTGDAQTKAAIHQQYASQTVYSLLEHVSQVLDEIAECQDTMDQGGMGLAHENLTTIRRHNEFVLQVFSKVQKNLQQMI